MRLSFNCINILFKFGNDPKSIDTQFVKPTPKDSKLSKSDRPSKLEILLSELVISISVTVRASEVNICPSKTNSESMPLSINHCSKFGSGMAVYCA
jgi:hypothetical protein